MATSFIHPLGYGLNKTGLPLIPIMVGNFGLCLIIDTGATISLIDSDVAERLGELVTRSDKGRLILGVDGQYKRAETSINMTFNIDKHLFTHSFTCKPLFDSLIRFKLESNILVHGILGCDFMIKNKWTINLDKGEITAP